MFVLARQPTALQAAPIVALHCGVVVLARQTTVRLRHYCTGRTNHCSLRWLLWCTASLSYWHGIPLHRMLRCTASLLYWHSKPLRGCAIVVLARQTTARLRRCCTGMANHCGLHQLLCCNAPLLYWYGNPHTSWRHCRLLSNFFCDVNKQLIRCSKAALIDINTKQHSGSNNMYIVKWKEVSFSNNVVAYIAMI